MSPNNYMLPADRVAVYAASGDNTPMGLFVSHARLRWLHGIIRWLSRDQFDLLPLLPHHGLSMVRSSGEQRLVALANLGTDALKDVAFHLPLVQPLERVQMLNDSGTWLDTPCSCTLADVPGVYQLTVPCRLNVFDWLILRWTRSGHP